MNFFLHSPDFKVSEYLVSKLNDPSDTPNGQASSSNNLSAKDRAVIEKMLIETEDLLESDDFKKVFVETIDLGYKVMMDLLVVCFLQIETEPGTSGKENSFKNPHTQSVPFAKLLPPLNSALKERNKSSDEGLSLVRHLLCTDVLVCFSANIYETFSGGRLQKS